MRYMHWYQCIYLVNNPEPVQYHIYAIAFPFNLRCESVTSVDICWQIFFYRTLSYRSKAWSWSGQILQLGKAYPNKIRPLLITTAMAYYKINIHNFAQLPNMTIFIFHQTKLGRKLSEITSRTQAKKGWW